MAGQRPFGWWGSPIPNNYAQMALAQIDQARWPGHARATPYPGSATGWLSGTEPWSGVGQRPLPWWGAPLPSNLSEKIHRSLNEARWPGWSSSSGGGGSGASSGVPPANAGGAIQVNSGINTGDTIWERALLPLMSNREFNDAVIQSTGAIKAFDQPGRSRDEGTWMMVSNAIARLLQEAAANALADRMRREAENRQYSNSLIDLAYQTGMGYQNALANSYLANAEEDLRSRLAGLQWIEQLLGNFMPSFEFEGF